MYNQLPLELDFNAGGDKKASMKTSIVRHCCVGLAAGLTFFLGCAKPSAETEQPRSVVAPAPSPVVAQSSPAPVVQTLPNSEAPPSTGTNVPAIIERVPPTVTPENVSLSTGLSEVVKLTQSGVAEDVILAYVEKYSGRFNVGAEQILYLNDVGVASTVITAMLKHDGAEGTVANPPGTPLPSVQTQVVSNLPQVPVTDQPAPAPAPVATTVAPPPTSSDAAYFYDALSPYGSWIYLSNYGWCWQPTVAVAVGDWRPYSDRGRWYWSDAGWYWNSDYSWGWAAFHYGRWYRHPGCGWVWTPGRVWAPSWVSWRYSPGYCGWAPLPPEAHFVSGFGFTYYGRHASIGFEFGLSDYHYSFVSIGNFCDYSPHRYYVPRSNVRNVYRNTTVVNNYIVGNNNTVINRGIGRETVARSSQNRIREVSVRETSLQHASQSRMDRVERKGNESVVLRPQLPSTPPPIRTAQFAGRSSSSGFNSVGRASTAGITPGNTIRSGSSVPPSTAGRVSTARTSSGTVTESRASERVTAPEAAPARPVVTPRAVPNESVSRSAGRSAVERPAAEPRSSARVQQSPVPSPSRANTPLFGDVPRTSTQPNASVPRSVTPPTVSAPRSQFQQPSVQPQQPRYSAPSAAGNVRSYSPAPAPSTPSIRSEPRNSPAPTYSPRQLEQTPRPSAPAYSVPRSSSGGGGGVSAPQAPSRSYGGGGRGEGAVGGGGGGGRGDRSDRGR